MAWRRFYGVHYLQHAECEVPEESSRSTSPFDVVSISSGDSITWCIEELMATLYSSPEPSLTPARRHSPLFHPALRPSTAAQSRRGRIVRVPKFSPGPSAQCQEAWTGNFTPTLHQEPSSQGSTGLPTLTFDMLGRSYRNAPPCTNIFPLSRLDRPVLLVEEAHPLHRLDFQDTEPEFKPVPAAQDESDLEDEVEVLVLDNNGDFEGQRETPETPPQTKRRWLQCLWSCFPRRRKIKPQKE